MPLCMPRGRGKGQVLRTEFLPRRDVWVAVVLTVLWWCDLLFSTGSCWKLFVALSSAAFAVRIRQVAAYLHFYPPENTFCIPPKYGALPAPQDVRGVRRLHVRCCAPAGREGEQRHKR